MAASVLAGLLACGALLAALGGLVLTAQAAGPVIYPAVSAPCNTTLQACIDGSVTGTTIVVQAGTYYTDGLTLSKAVSLTGVSSATVILNALAGQRVLTVTEAAVDSSVIISGLTFMGGQAPNGPCPSSDGNGGGMLITDSAKPLLINVRFVNNTAACFGGGLYADGPVSISGAQFTGNNAGIGGGLYANKHISITDAQFAGKWTTSGGGGGLNANEDGTLTNTLFISNNSDCLDCFGNGGGLLAIGAASIVNSSFVNNIAGGYGGGLYGSDVTVLNTNFVGNSTGVDAFCPTDGGGMMATGVATITGANFLSNTAGIGGGGGLFVYGITSVSNSQFFMNNASTHGGGMVAFGPATIADSQFISNNSGGGAGGLDVLDGLTLTRTSLVNNMAAGTGGGAQIGLFQPPYPLQDTSSRHLVNVLMAGNRAGGEGDELYFALRSGGTNAIILHSTFADPTQGPGAAIFVSTGLAATNTIGITDTIIASHTVGIENAGGIVIEDYNLLFQDGLNLSSTVTSGGHSLNGDPRFVNPAGSPSGYHLSDGSMAVDAGTNAGVTTDFDGDPRPQGAGFDIGFDESPFAAADVGVTKSANVGVRQPGQTLT